MRSDAITPATPPSASYSTYRWYQVRNAGTIGGNIANGSPIGDMPPGLIALGAKLVLQSTQGQRVCDLEDYFISYGKQDLHAGECVAQVRLPCTGKPVVCELQGFQTFEQDISAVCGAFAMQIKIQPSAMHGFVSVGWLKPQNGPRHASRPLKVKPGTRKPSTRPCRPC